ncbi:MAG TPA: hypothetical protein VJ872_09690 [Nocardioides sp.]|nr:hypothetical protein [Nocardioides sp.]
MSVVRRLTVSILCCLALGVGMLAVAPAGPARAADSAACTHAKDEAAHALRRERVTHHRLAMAKKALKKAKHSHVHRKAKVKKARALVHKRTRQHHSAVVALRNARAAQASACANNGGGGSTTPDPAAGLGSLLALLTASLNGGSVPALDASQLTTLLDTLYPGASSALNPAQLTEILSSFGGASALDPSQLTNLLAGLPGADQLDPTVLVGLLSGGSLDPTQLTNVLTTLTGALGDLGPTGLGNPADATSVITSLLGALSDPTQALGTLLGLLAAAGNGGSIPTLGATQLTTLLDGLYPGASSALDPSQLTALLGSFPGAGSLDASQLGGLLAGLGASGVDPTQLLAVLGGGSLDPSQLTALTGEITGLLNSVSGGSFTSPSNPLGTIGTLLQSILGGVLCGILPIC